MYKFGTTAVGSPETQSYLYTVCETMRLLINEIENETRYLILLSETLDSNWSL